MGGKGCRYGVALVSDCGVAAVSLGSGSAMVRGLAGAALSAGGAPYGFQGAVFRGFRRQSRKQLWVGHVFFRFGTSGLQELVQAEEFAAESAAVGGPFGFAGVEGEGGRSVGACQIEAVRTVQ